MGAATARYPTTTKLAALADAANVEVFHVDGAEAARNRAEARKHGALDDDAQCTRAGWYYWQCFPGCLPEGSATGPFTSARAALRDAYDNEWF